MADLARIKRNVAKMASQNAPEADIDGYIASEGVTIDDVRNFRTQSGHSNVPEYVPPGVEGYNQQTGEVTPQYSMGGSAAMGAADAATLGWGDELASYPTSWLSGVPRGQVLSEMRGNAQTAQEQNPGSYLTGQIAGGLGQAAATGGAGFGPSAAKAGAGLGRVALGSAIDGTLYGGTYGSGSANGDLKDRLAGMISGGGTGFIVGGSIPLAVAGASRALKKAVTPFAASPERTAAADFLASEGVPLTAGQKTGSDWLRYRESELGGGKAAKMMEDQAEAFTSAALKRAGGQGRATPDRIDNMFDRIGGEFDYLARNNTMFADKQMASELRSTLSDYQQMVPPYARAPIVEDAIKDIAETRSAGLTGDAYQSLRSRLDKGARAAKTDPNLSEALYGIRNSLDDAMERSIAETRPDDLGAWREARRQYRNMLVIEKAATGAGENAAQGLISPSALRNATVTGQGRRAYARGKGDFAQLARAGEALMKPLPNSGTAQRVAAQGISAAVMGGVGSAGAGIPGLALGLAGPALAGRALMSGSVQRYLANQAASGAVNPVRDAIAAALLRGGAIPAIEGR